jgi:hypothetical protein
MAPVGHTFPVIDKPSIYSLLNVVSLYTASSTEKVAATVSAFESVEPEQSMSMLETYVPDTRVASYASPTQAMAFNVLSTDPSQFESNVTCEFVRRPFAAQLP